MKYIVTDEQALDAALAQAAYGDIVMLEGRVLLSKPLTLTGVQGLPFVAAGASGGAFDMMRAITDFSSVTVNGCTVWTAPIPEEIAVLKPYDLKSHPSTLPRRPSAIAHIVR